MNTFTTCRLFVAILFLSGIYGCSDPASAPTGRIDDGAPKDDGQSFAILGVGIDSLYGGESSSMTVRNLGEDPTMLSLYVHTQQARIDSVIGDQLFFTVNAGNSGKIRLYKGDSLAFGDHTFHVFGRDRKSLFPMTFQSSQGPFIVGEQITITGRDMPLRARDIYASLNGVPLPIEQFDSSFVLARVPPEASSGHLVLTLFGKDYPLHLRTVIKTGEESLANARFTSVSISAVQLAGITLITEGKDSANSFISFPEIQFGVATPVAKTEQLTIVGDSLIYLSKLPNEYISVESELRLFEHPNEDAISGTARMVNIVYAGTDNERRTVVELRIERMPYRKDDIGYTIFANGSDIRKYLTELSFESQDKALERSHRVTQYDGGKSGSEFSIMLTRP